MGKEIKGRISAIATLMALLFIGCSPPHAEKIVHYKLGSLSDDIMTIENQDSEDWNGVEICLNAQPRNGYMYRIEHLKSGAVMPIELRDFAKEDGSRFDFNKTTITQFWIGGGGYDWSGKERQ